LNLPWISAEELSDEEFGGDEDCDGVSRDVEDVNLSRCEADFVTDEEEELDVAVLLDCC
jgi:hypothetical protein